MEFLFRADASAAIGSGHVMRCLALAEALIAAGHRCHFAVAETPGSIERRLVAAGATVHRVTGDVRTTLDVIAAVRPRGIVIDGYGFMPEWRRAVREAGVPVLAFEDRVGEDPGYADLVLNAAADPATAGAGDVEWLLGPRYVLLRRELVEAAALPPLDMTDRRSILVTFGGTDPAGLTLPVAAGLVRRLPAALDVVIGGGAPDAETVAAAVTALGGDVRVHLDPPKMGGLMRQAGLAVSAAGGTVGELAVLGVPAIIMVVADNQRQGAAAAAASGWCEAVDARQGPEISLAMSRAASLWADPAERARRAAIARRLVDPHGAARVAAALIARANA